jgi:hypothetical protein
MPFPVYVGMHEMRRARLPVMGRVARPGSERAVEYHPAFIDDTPSIETFRAPRCSSG